jgi:glutamine synthetase
VHTREIIYNIANKHGLRATLAPRVYQNSCKPFTSLSPISLFIQPGGSATHAHISVHSSKCANTTTSRPDLSDAESAFLASLLSHLPALVALTMPVPASYSRMVDGAWSGGTYVCWGIDNREAPVRLCNASSPTSRNFEIKCLDGMANPYLALAAILGVGHAGIRDATPLEMRDCSGSLSAAALGEEGRKALGITQRMPLTWEKARDSLRNDPVVRSVLGEDMLNKYLDVNKVSF